ncbi:STAS domain-containing protein [Roseivirga sp. BDSF3-8]|uniref:STAS domain-containing protein n=1 Tax=Roseivirga sp. BDSF3-8 TaxID=3241598 RepID=UPI00353223DD
MNLEIKAITLDRPSDMDYLNEVIVSRSRESSSITIDLEDVDTINLATFNSLIVLYVKLRRMGKSVRFTNCHAPRVKDLITKTHFSHVFYSK